MLISPGDLMDYGEIETSRDRIFATRYFQGIKYEIEDGSSNETNNLIVQVEENGLKWNKAKIWRIIIISAHCFYCGLLVLCG